jgi:ribosomal protein S10
VAAKTGGHKESAESVTRDTFFDRINRIYWMSSKFLPFQPPARLPVRRLEWQKVKSPHGEGRAYQNVISTREINLAQAVSSIRRLFPAKRDYVLSLSSGK